jgi:predicted nucleotidyltransferase component of viral defense system
VIRPGEIQNKARETGVRDTQIEKDYVLSWILKGIAQHARLSQELVFKGGTVLKKVYFEDYRFSEDLDFTLRDAEVTNEQITTWFNEVFVYVREEANIPLTQTAFETHTDGGIFFNINFTGPLGGAGNNKQVKVDISRSEKLVFEPVTKDAILSYTDLEEYQLLCYSLEEFLVEKMRCVIQRVAARDFYDIWYLLEHEGMEADFYLNEFSAKCAAKNIKPGDFPKKLEERLPQYKGRWENSLNEQIQNLPDFNEVVRETKKHLKTINFEPKNGRDKNQGKKAKGRKG